MSRSRWSPALRPAAIAAVILVAVLLTGCGSSRRPAPHLKAAEPAHDPHANAHPAGVSTPVGMDPQGIAVAGPLGLVAVGTHNPSSIVLLGARTDRVLGRISIADAPRHLALVNPAGPLLVPEEDTNQLAVIDLSTRRSRSFPTGDFPHAATAIDGDIYVGDERAARLTEILPDGRESTITGIRQPGGLADVDGDIAAVDVAAFTVSLFDPRTNRFIARLPAGAGPTHDAAADGDVYVLDTRGNAILTYSANPFRQIDRLSVPGSPYGIAIDPRRHDLWVTLTGENRVAEFSLTDGKPHLLRSWPTGLQPDTVAVDEATGEAFVANQVSGTVEAIRP